MNAYLLTGVMWFACAADDDKLIQQLDEDFETILKTEKDPVPLRKAAKLLETTKDSWTDYAQALSLLRQNRSKAEWHGVKPKSCRAKG
jgi:hypothetical protein